MGKPLSRLIAAAAGGAFQHAQRVGGASMMCSRAPAGDHRWRRQPPHRLWQRHYRPGAARLGGRADQRRQRQATRLSAGCANWCNGGRAYGPTTRLTPKPRWDDILPIAFSLNACGRIYRLSGGQKRCRRSGIKWWH
jgi:hypothetical protein